MLVLTNHGPSSHLTSTARSIRPWSAKEDTQLRHAYEQLKLDGEPLHRWCLREGVSRTRGEIDNRLIVLKIGRQPVTEPAVKSQGTKNRDLCYNPWREEELGLLMRGAIDLELTGRRLEGWLKREGIFRVRADIRAKLAEVGYEHRTLSDAKLARVIAGNTRFTDQQKAAASAALRDQIALARQEAATAPPYKPGIMEW